jgi:hypothetical protein
MRIPLQVSVRTFAWLGGGLFLFVGLGFLYGGIEDAAKERAYRQRGQAVQALVVAKSIRRASRDGNSGTKYEIAYRFTTADGQAHDGVEVVSVDDWERLEPGKPLMITYLPDEPQARRAAEKGGMRSALVMGGLGGVLALLGGGLLTWSAVRLWRERRLLRSGAPTQGTILAIEPSSLAVNRVRQWNVRYSYRDHSGQTHEGSSGPVPPDHAHALNVGDEVKVRFDAERPEQSIWVPASRDQGVDESERQFSYGKGLRNTAVVFAVLAIALVIGESVPPLKALDRFAAEHEFWLTATTVGVAFVGFLLFMGGILYRIFASTAEPITHTQMEDLSRNVNVDAEPAAARVSAYRFRGPSTGAAFADQFTLREARAAWRQRAWRKSPRWRANLVVAAGALLFTVGLFGFFVVGAPAGIKLLFVAVLLYGAVRLVAALRRA